MEGDPSNEIGELKSDSQYELQSLQAAGLELRQQNSLLTLTAAFVS
jgi:hypothetical protein